VVCSGDDVLAFMDNRPINTGHILLIPKAHLSNLFDLDPATYGRLLDLARALARSLQRVCRPRRVGLLVAGFDIPHAHVHLVPLHDYHDLTSRAILENRRGAPTSGELATLAQELRNDVGRFGEFAS